MRSSSPPPKSPSTEKSSRFSASSPRKQSSSRDGASSGRHDENDDEGGVDSNDHRPRAATDPGARLCRDDKADRHRQVPARDERDMGVDGTDPDDRRRE